MSIAFAIGLTICAVNTLTDRKNYNKKKEEDNLRISKLTAQERKDEAYKKYLTNMSR